MSKHPGLTEYSLCIYLLINTAITDVLLQTVHQIYHELDTLGLGTLGNAVLCIIKK